MHKLITDMLEDKMVNSSMTRLGGQGGPTVNAEMREAGDWAQGGWGPTLARSTGLAG